MLSLEHPELIHDLSTHPVGILTKRINENELILILKLTKEMILAAKISNGFKISFVPYFINGQKYHALLSLFTDNNDEPLSLMNTFYDNQESKDIIRLFSQDNIKTYFFDELNRELLAYNSTITDRDSFRAKESSFRSGIKNDRPEGISFEDVNQWYFDAHDKNIENTFEVSFTSEIYSAPTLFIDSTQLFSPMPGDFDFLHYSLVREEPGAQQELDILLLLKKILPHGDFYLNPVRTDTKKEFVDIFAIDGPYALLVQAKDSPNTEKSLTTTISRKRSKTLSHLKKASEQMKGAINHQKKSSTLELSGRSTKSSVNIAGLKTIGLIVVKELFAEDVKIYLNTLVSIFQDTGVVCMLVDYTELHLYSIHTQSERFFGTLEFLHANAIMKGTFARARFQ